MRSLPYVLALSLVSLAAARAAAPAPSPSDFVSDAIKADNSEIQMGKLAEDQGKSAAVKRYGRMLVADHTKAKDQASEVAQKIGVSPSSDITPDAQSEMQKLKGLKGTDFDSEFASFMTDDHQKDIETFKAEAAAKNGPASTMAASELPTLRKHLRMAQSLEKTKG